MTWPPRRWLIHVAWSRADGRVIRLSNRTYTQTFPWFTPGDRIVNAIDAFVRSEVGGSDYAVISLWFRPNRGRKPTPNPLQRTGDRPGVALGSAAEAGDPS